MSASHDKKKRKKKEKESSDSSDHEQLMEISKKYKNRRLQQQPEEIPILKKSQVALAAQANQTTTPSTALPAPVHYGAPVPPIASSGPPVLAQYPKGASGAYRIPQYLHKNYPHAVYVASSQC